MNEIAEIHRHVLPDQTLFVVDAMTGQDAVNTAAAFNQRLNFDGVVLTKMDGDACGGAALTISYTVGKPIKYVSTGEKLQALDVFHRTAWPTEFWAWAMSCLWSKRPSSKSTLKKPPGCKRKFPKSI